MRRNEVMELVVGGIRQRNGSFAVQERNAAFSGILSAVEIVRAKTRKEGRGLVPDFFGCSVVDAQFAGAPGNSDAAVAKDDRLSVDTLMGVAASQLG